MNEQEINRIKQKASDGDPKAAYNYAECLEDGDGVRQNLQESFKFYLFAANQGIRRAQRRLGVEALTSGNIYDWYKYLISSPRNNQYVKRRAMYELGYFYKMNNQLSDAFQLFLDAARLEETDAEYEVAKAYKDGLGVVKDSKEAFNWYKKAADNGCVDAKLWMGIYYETGLDGVVDKNKEEANRLYEEIQDENQVAKYNLAMNIKNGEGCDTDLKKAFQLLIDLSEDGFQNASKVLGDAINTGDINDWYKKLEKEGDVEAIFQLAELDHNKGVPYDQEPCYSRYITAANEGHAKALYIVAQIYKSNGNIWEYLRYLHRSANEGFADAEFDYGIYLRNVQDRTNEDALESFQYLIDAEKGGNVEANFAIGYAYSEGIGVEKNYDKAVEYFEKYIVNNGGNAKTAYSNIGVLYFEGGEKLAKDKRAAFIPFQKAAKMGDAKAQWYMGRYYDSGYDAIEINHEIAYSWYKKAAEHGEKFYGYDQCCFKLAYDLKNGVGTTVNLQDAFHWYNKAADEDYKPAIKELGRAYQTENIQDWYIKLVNEEDNAGAAYLAAKNYKAWDNTEKYLYYLKLSADENFLDAEYDYGLYLRNKEGHTKEEVRLSFQYLLRAANNEYVDAMNSVGYAYAKGIGVEENGQESVGWYRMYIKKEGNDTKTAYSNIGIEYFYGKKNLEKNAKEAFKAFYQASELGYARAQYYMGLFYDNGYDVVKQDHKKAISYYKRALSQEEIFQNYDRCCYHLAYDLKNGQGTDIDLSEAFQWYQSAATKGEKRALDELGISCETGDIKDWLIKLDDQGDNPDAMVLLAQILMDESDEKYTGNNLHEAFSLLLKASEIGNETARRLMGASYESKDIKDWYEQLSKEGNIEAKFQLAEMLSEQENSNISEECLQLYQSAASDGCVEASYRLASYYRDNDHQDMDLYAKYLKMSVTEKYPQYMFEYACFIYDADCKNADKIIQKAADLGLKEAQVRFGQILYSGNDDLGKNYKKAYEYLKMGASEDDDYKKYPYDVNPYALNYGFWLRDLYENGDSYAGTLYVLQPEFRTEQLDRNVLKEVILYLGNTSSNNNTNIEENLIWTFEQLCETTGNLDEVFSYLQNYEELIKQYNMFDKSDVLKKYYIDECVDQFLNAYIEDSANWYRDESGHKIYKVPDLSKEVPDIETNDDEKDFWYDCALTFDLSGKYAKSIFIYEYAALLGSRKAWYTLGNMAQEESQYFLEIIDNY